MKKFAMAIAVAALVAFAAPAFAAMNPFMDVPASHWAYDAIAQLAARGVISGYPDGTYKGARPTTRYEMASALARALAKIDMEKASKQDVEMLKKLIVEFKDELDALGVKVDQLDSRVAVLEKDLGGWSLSGHFRMDWMIGNNDGRYDKDAVVGKNHMDLNRYRIWLRKRINETTSFTARIGKEPRNGTQAAVMRWEHYYVTMKLPYNITMHVGRKDLDWEGDLGLYKENEPLVGDMTFAMFHFLKDWGMANLQLVVGRHNDNTGYPTSWNTYEYDKNSGTWGNKVNYTNPRMIEQYVIAGLANFDFTERFRGGLMAYYLFSNGSEKEYGPDNEADMNLLTAGIYLGYKFTPAVELKGIYYYQKQGDGYKYGIYGNERHSGYADPNTAPIFDDDKANAWKIILDVNQEALKFTSLWLEYGQIDNNFETMRYGRGISAEDGMFSWSGDDIFDNTPYNTDKTKYFFIRADQKWSNTKWRSFLRYAHVDFGTDGISKAKQWGLGIAYRLNPAVEFELSYDKIDFGDGVNNPYKTGDDNIVRLRTFVTF